MSDFTEGSAQVSIKWPNDILLNQKRVAGILLETIAVGKNEIALSIGFGVNYCHTQRLQSWKKVPSVLHLFDRNWIAIDPIELLNKLAVNFSKYEGTLQDKGFTELRSSDGSYSRDWRSDYCENDK